jgi:hypothetical protein
MNLSKEILAARRAVEFAKRKEETVPEGAFDTRNLEQDVAEEINAVFEAWKKDIIKRLKDAKTEE